MTSRLIFSFVNKTGVNVNRSRIYSSESLVILSGKPTSNSLNYCDNAFTDEDFEKRCRDVVDLVKSHQEGIPLSKIAVFYKGEYGRTLRKKELGFSSIADFIDSLNQELCVENGKIFYRIAKSEASPPAGNDMLLMLQYNSSVVLSHVVLLCFLCFSQHHPCMLMGLLKTLWSWLRTIPQAFLLGSCVCFSIKNIGGTSPCQSLVSKQSPPSLIL